MSVISPCNFKSHSNLQNILCSIKQWNSQERLKGVLVTQFQCGGGGISTPSTASALDTSWGPTTQLTVYWTWHQTPQVKGSVPRYLAPLQKPMASPGCYLFFWGTSCKLEVPMVPSSSGCQSPSPDCYLCFWPNGCKAEVLMTFLYLIIQTHLLTWLLLKDMNQEQM